MARRRPSPARVEMLRFLAQLLRIELVPVLVDESQLREGHPILLPNNPLHRIAEPNNHHRLQCARNGEILPHLLILDPRVDSGDDSLIPGGYIHLLLSVSMLESVPILKNSLDSKGFAIRET